jgi:hypothetical protein
MYISRWIFPYTDYYDKCYLHQSVRIARKWSIRQIIRGISNIQYIFTELLRS